MNNWGTIRAKGNNAAELIIYGDIGESWYGESTTASRVVDDLKALDVSTIIVRINSYGGSVADGLAIFNALRSHKADINVRIEGVAVSIASLIAMAGDTVDMAENAMFMVHAPWGSNSGNSKAMREFADLLDKYAEAMATSYARKTGKPTDEILSLLTDGEDHWYTAAEALAEGFVDSITEEVAIAAHGFNKSRFNNQPMRTTEMTKDEILAAERQRKTDIRAAFTPFLDREGIRPLLDTCIDDDKISAEAARAKLLAKLGEGVEPLAGNPNINIGYDDHHTDFRAAATDALLMRGGVALKDAHPASRDIRGMSIASIAATLLRQRGHSTTGLSPMQTIVDAMGTSDLPWLLANTANKALMLGYEMEPASHRMWTRDEEVRDFKPNSRVAISEAPELLEVMEHGEYQHGYLSERAESFTLATYGRIMAISRQALINDDLNAFTRVPQAFGASAARLEADKVYTMLTSNPAMSDGVALFHADHGNLLSAAALSVDTLGLARAAMRKQKGPNGGTLNVVPAFLIVPAALETKAEQLLASLVDPSKSNDTTNLAWIRSLTLVTDARLDAVSETGWYLAARHEQVDTVVVAHLEGERGVFVEQEQAFSTDQVRMKARLDFATQALDWVGMTYNPGA